MYFCPCATVKFKFQNKIKFRNFTGYLKFLKIFLSSKLKIVNIGHQPP